MSIGAKRLLDTMNSAGVRASAQVASQLVYGTVSSVNPLTITRDGDVDRDPLTENFLVLSRTCKRLYAGGALVWDDLAVGDTVVLLSFNSGQKHFVERV